MICNLAFQCGRTFKTDIFVYVRRRSASSPQCVVGVLMMRARAYGLQPERDSPIYSPHRHDRRHAAMYKIIVSLMHVKSRLKAVFGLLFTYSPHRHEGQHVAMSKIFISLLWHTAASLDAPPPLLPFTDSAVGGLTLTLLVGPVGPNSGSCRTK
jgi:hypothetical protein